ncbi:MAG: UDP-N-acetylmuramate:L-alanyl-gamma-D-glutamyl-meso-diaminopimelate ligase [Thiomargarita sp.]|nr:UDP-N-acetylmuramate:L-alanyl-gamma-D-glutamyl-meso-diaminopimelate ligase [Thiomargarita sp.]
MHIHILGICGTFMAGIAILARQQGHKVTGSDIATYPPMTTQLKELGITYYTGYSATNLNPQPDCVIIGNALSRGNPEVEAVLNKSLPYISGAQWLSEQVLATRWVLAVAGTHGKTTTASMLAWILEEAGSSPGFLIGGIPENFGLSSRLEAESPFFVIEADEYDTAFFDKRSKFVHYRPRTLVINNLEFDHADIFPDLAAIQRQFHHLIRTVPNNGLIIHKNQELAIEEVIQQGCWTTCKTIGQDAQSNWYCESLVSDYSHFKIGYENQFIAEIKWNLIGEHNAHNALAAISAAHHVKVPLAIACEALETFQGVKRRLQLRGTVNEIRVYDDFAHHPTAIKTTLQALRQRVKQQRIIAVLEPRSNTMRMGVHKETLAPALQLADMVALYQPSNLDWSLAEMANSLPNTQIFTTTESLITFLVKNAQAGDHIIIMSNGGFENIHQRLLTALD